PERENMTKKRLMPTSVKAEKTKKIDKRLFLLNLVLISVFVVVILVVGAYGGLKTFTEREVFAENVTIYGEAVGGLSYTEGRNQVLQKQEETFAEISIPVEFNGSTHVFTAQELGVSENVEDTVTSAYMFNKQGQSVTEDYLKSFETLDIEAEVTVDRRMMENYVGAFIAENSVEPVDATAEFDSSTREFSYTESKEGLSADIAALCDLLEKKIQDADYSTLTVEKTVVAPALSTEELISNTALIGRCETELADSEARNRNINEACSVLTGYTIMPEATLSLNDLFGQRTEDKGYVAASAIPDGKLETEEIGGGISQVAGTLYNAALLADMEIVERSRNSWPPDYLEVGLDAALSWDDKDLKIKNHTKYPMYIAALFVEGAVVVEIYGQSSEYDIEVENKILKETPIPSPQHQFSSEYKSGENVVLVEGKKGYEVEVYRHYLQGDILVRSELVSEDYFPEIRSIIVEGTG
ncbi:MAG: VanW family protein, partial [Christensenellaceae bacterium]